MYFYDFTPSMLENYFLERGENKAKAKILYKAIYRSRISLNEIDEIGDRVKSMLSGDYTFELPKAVTVLENSSTAKALLKLSDGNKVETVLMKHQYGAGLCISTQVGCAMNCAFCQSGKLKKRRNLTAGEMVAQVLFMANICEVKHISIMGIGEPLDNFDNVKDFLEIVSSPYGFAFGGRHITLSTCGIVPMIDRLKEIDCGFNLAISLHAPNDEIRSRLMPVNNRWNLKQLMDKVRDYSLSENKRIAFEYILLDGINDSLEQAEELARLVEGIDCFINLIPYNPTDTSDFKRSENADNFYRLLQKLGVNAIFRREFGSDIKAACGQLSADYD